MASINNTPRPAYVYDTATNEWIPIGVGAHSHNEIPKTVVDAKGDLIVGTAADEVNRLAVGTNGYTLVADSTQTTGLAYSGTTNGNPVINGGMDIWQRGTSFSIAAASAVTYTTDRWCIKTGTNQAITVSRQATGDSTNLPFIQYCTRVQRNSGQTGTGGLDLVQNIETINAIPYAGKTVSLSFYARAGANYSATSNALAVGLYSGTGTDQNLYSGFTGSAQPINGTATLTTTWQRFTYSGTIASTATELAIDFSFSPTGTASTNDYYEVTGVQIDLGSTALPFRRSGGTIQGELAACQRYYAKSYAQGTAPQTNTTTGIRIAYLGGTTVTNGYLVTSNQLPVVMRGAPTVTVYSQGGTAGSFTNIASGSDSGANTGVALYITDASFAIYNNSGGNLTGGNGGVSYHYVASAEL